MQDYDFWNFWADLLGTFQSAPDWFKTLWLLIPVGVLLAVIALLTRFRIVSKKVKFAIDGELIYSIHRGPDNALLVVGYGPHVDKNPAILMFNPPKQAPQADEDEAGNA